MSDLRRIRDVNWDEVEADEVRLLRETTIAESLRDYLLLQREFEPMLQATDALFRPEREAYLIRLQERLRRLDEWKGDPVDRLHDSLVEFQRRLNDAGIPSAAIGGLAVGAWGKARLTRDVDLKILLNRDSRQRLLDLLTAEYTSLHADPDRALQRNGVLFVRDSLGTRLDILLADTEYDELLISRAQMVEILPGKHVRVCTAEDLIVLKLIASRPTDVGDVEGVVQRQGDKLDEAYVLDWLGKFEKALDDGTLLREYRRIRERYRKP